MKLKVNMKDTIGKSIIIGIVLLAATAAIAMDRATMTLMFWGGSSEPAPSGYWQRVDDTDILRVDGTQIEVFA